MIESCLKEIKDRIRASAGKAGRNPDDIELVLVTKEVEIEQIKAAYDLGERHFGENRAQDLEAKKDALPEDIRWHFIGHLQTNKVKKLVGKTALLHSMDRIELAREIQKVGQHTEALLQVNASGEDTKHGFHPDAVERAVTEMMGFDQLKILGLMTIGPNTKDEAKIRAAFSLLRNLRDKLKVKFPTIDWRYLSMGMSSDFELAIEEGANLLRIGSAVFGERKQKVQ